MCKPISLIITENKVFLPSNDSWNHSHTNIMKLHNIPDGLIGDKYLRLEVTPKNDIFRNPKTNKVLEVNNTWKVKVDETNIPEWYSNDLVAQEHRVRESAKKWLKNFPDNLIPGYRKIAGDYSILTAGNDSILTAGDYSTLTAGNGSTLTGGNRSTLTAGDSSILTGGNRSTLTAGYYSTLTGGNNSTLTGGNNSTLTGGDFSTLSGGNSSKLTGGDESTLIGENSSILTGGNYSIFCAGENSSFSSTYWDVTRIRTIVFYVGENGILPNKKYKIFNGKIYDFEIGEEVK